MFFNKLILTMVFVMSVLSCNVHAECVTVVPSLFFLDISTLETLNEKVSLSPENATTYLAELKKMGKAVFVPQGKMVKVERTHSKNYIAIEYHGAKFVTRSSTMDCASPAQSQERLNKDSKCYKLGVRWGRCFMMSHYGLKCDPHDDFSMPTDCRNTREATMGSYDGSLEVVKILDPENAPKTNAP